MNKTMGSGWIQFPLQGLHQDPFHMHNFLHGTIWNESHLGHFHQWKDLGIVHLDGQLQTGHSQQGILPRIVCGGQQHGGSIEKIHSSRHNLGCQLKNVHHGRHPLHETGPPGGNDDKPRGGRVASRRERRRHCVLVAVVVDAFLSSHDRKNIVQVIQFSNKFTR